MIDYINGKIYKLTGSGLTYYGSTTQLLSKRLYEHKLKGNKSSSKQIIELGNYDICLVELFPCNSKEELHKRERFYIENNECINKHIPTRTTKEYYEIHKERLNKLNKEYQEINKEKIIKYKKEYRKINKEKIKEQYKNNYEKYKEKKKEYQEQNKEQIKEKRKIYNEKNKERIAEYYKNKRLLDKNL